MIEVSVIVPVYNSESFVQKCINALLIQSIPAENYEIIFVDNGSTDNTCDVISNYERVKLLHEHEIQSSYAARNRGIAEAKGDIIAFADADTIPNPDWLRNGIECMKRSDADLVGGCVKFIFSPKRTAAEYYDSFLHMQNKRLIEIRGVAATANLFVKRDVFQQIGNFPGDVKSGGDFIFTKRATDAGLKLRYCPDAVVGHPTRDFKALARKALRTGIGHTHILKEQGTPRSLLRDILGLIRSILTPRSPSLWKTRIEEDGLDIGRWKMIEISFVTGTIESISRLGHVVGHFKK
jgi:glycosyltransferase involved in cell wall biosynthesis